MTVVSGSLARSRDRRLNRLLATLRMASCAFVSAILKRKPSTVSRSALSRGLKGNWLSFFIQLAEILSLLC